MLPGGTVSWFFTFGLREFVDVLEERNLGDFVDKLTELSNLGDFAGTSA